MIKNDKFAQVPFGAKKLFTVNDEMGFFGFVIRSKTTIFSPSPLFEKIFDIRSVLLVMTLFAASKCCRLSDSSVQA